MTETMYQLRRRVYDWLWAGPIYGFRYMLLVWFPFLKRIDPTNYKKIARVFDEWNGEHERRRNQNRSIEAGGEVQGVGDEPVVECGGSSKEVRTLYSHGQRWVIFSTYTAPVAVLMWYRDIGLASAEKLRSFRED